MLARPFRPSDGIYRISTMAEPYEITFNQFLIDDERPTLIHIRLGSARVSRADLGVLAKMKF
jgi:hypothetical protein